ncbi:hypothetical protein F4824DRAFT_398588 [Ustulina deusta]|nr:hypothetical protein F4824DRAFT_398588 [Ustulina deusta]
MHTCIPGRGWKGKGEPLLFFIIVVMGYLLLFTGWRGRQGAVLNKYSGVVFFSPSWAGSSGIPEYLDRRLGGTWEWWWVFGGVLSLSLSLSLWLWLWGVCAFIEIVLR